MTKINDSSLNLDTTSFSGNLAAADSLQEALDLLDIATFGNASIIDETSNIVHLTNPTDKFVVGGTTIDSGGTLQVKGTDGGIIPPKLTTVQRDAIVTPVSGVTIFNTTTSQLEFYTGSAWVGTQNAAAANAPLSVSGDTISLDLETTNPGLIVVANKLDVKLKSGGGISKDADGLYADGALGSYGVLLDVATNMNGSGFYNFVSPINLVSNARLKFFGTNPDSGLTIDIRYMTHAGGTLRTLTSEQDTYSIGASPSYTVRGFNADYASASFTNSETTKLSTFGRGFFEGSIYSFGTSLVFECTTYTDDHWVKTVKRYNGVAGATREIYRLDGDNNDSFTLTILRA